MPSIKVAPPFVCRNAAMAAAPVAALAGFEPVAATLEAGGLAGKAVFGLGNKIV